MLQHVHIAFNQLQLFESPVLCGHMNVFPLLNTCSTCMEQLQVQSVGSMSVYDMCTVTTLGGVLVGGADPRSYYGAAVEKGWAPPDLFMA